MPEITEDELKAFKDAAKINKDLTTKVSGLESSNSRITDESNKFKKRAQDAETKISDGEKKKLEDEGKTGELLAQERKEKLVLQDKLDKSNKSVMKEKLRTEVLKFAKDAHDVDMVLRVNEHKDLLKIDNEALTVEGIEDYVKKVRETHSYLFGKKSMKVDASGKVIVEDKDKSTDEVNFQSELKKVTTRKEQKAVYIKYGKNTDSFM